MNSLKEQIRLLELRATFLKALDRLQSSKSSAADIAKLYAKPAYKKVARHDDFMDAMSKNAIQVRREGFL